MLQQNLDLAKSSMKENLELAKYSLAQSFIYAQTALHSNTAAQNEQLLKTSLETYVISTYKNGVTSVDPTVQNHANTNRKPRNSGSPVSSSDSEIENDDEYLTHLR